MSGAAGFFPAGIDGGAGFGPTPPSTTPRDVKPPHALYLDPSVMDFTKDDAGLYQSVHPVDSKAEIAWALAFGSAASAPGIGSTIRDLQIGSREQMSRDALEIARAAVATVIAAGDLVIVSVVAYAAAANRANVTITYQNTRAPDADRNRTVVLP